jgi:hypothetical protein
MPYVDDADALVQASIPLPFNYAFTARLKPSTVKKTALMLVPWAIYMVLPKGKARQVAFVAASRVSPLARPRVKPGE